MIARDLRRTSLKTFLAVAFLFAFVFPQTNAQTSADADPLKPLSFLEGTWQAKTRGGSAGADASATYTFQRELRGRILARHSHDSSGCQGPVTFDCDHSDLLYIYPGPDHRALKAVYFDNEGHVIRYDVAVTDPGTAVFTSDSETKGPQFRLVYELTSTVMSGKFQLRAPGQTDWKSYLEWSGERR
jgi:hypothetical protein